MVLWTINDGLWKIAACAKYYLFVQRCCRTFLLLLSPLSLDLGTGYYGTNQNWCTWFHISLVPLNAVCTWLFRFGISYKIIYVVDIIKWCGAVAIVYQCLFLLPPTSYKWWWWQNFLKMWFCGNFLNMMALFVFCPREICYIHLVSFLILAACQDSFTRCFKSIPPEPWNWNVYLFPLWCLGVVVRYGFLFPLRLASTWSKVVYPPEVMMKLYIFGLFWQGWNEVTYQNLFSKFKVVWFLRVYLYIILLWRQNVSALLHKYMYACISLDLSV